MEHTLHGSPERGRIKKSLRMRGGRWGGVTTERTEDYFNKNGHALGDEGDA